MVGMDGMIHGFGTLVGVMVGITGVGDDLGDGITVGIMAMAGTTGAGTLVGVMAGIIGAGDLDGVMAGTIGAGMVTTEATDMLTMQEEEVQ
tara:strand:+ start:3996 stop:4268 length:273 start_codon:yes stop_codon:yes gene_type:complete